MKDEQTAAIFWAQWRSFWNRRLRGKQKGFPWLLVFNVVWYGMWLFLACLITKLTADPDNLPAVVQQLPGVLLTVCIYWQLIPIVMMSTGRSLDLKRFVVYPVSYNRLFLIEVVLCAFSLPEMLLVCGGIFLGLLLSGSVPVWAPFALIPFVITNILAAAGLRDLLSKLLAKKGLRELLILVLVTVSALPQLLLSTGAASRLPQLQRLELLPYSPWQAAAKVSLGYARAGLFLVLFAWILIAYRFARHQFISGINIDAINRKRGRIIAYQVTAVDVFARRLSSLFSDPIGALLEKEIRVLVRSPRFRLLFFMGFSFGLLIWLPLVLEATEGSTMHRNYLTMINGYALLLLGEVLFWNSFGMDRTAAQNYFVAPVTLSQVIVAKNLAAAVFVLLECLIIDIFSSLLPRPTSGQMVLESSLITAVLTLFLLSAGNLIAVRQARPIDPAKSWRSASGSTANVFLFALYPLISAPIVLAYGARYAFRSEAAFFGVLIADLLIGAGVYFVALESSVATAEARKEELLFSLSQSQDPVAG